MSSTIPAVVDNHLDVLKHFPDGKVILGSSNLTGRYWSGSLWCFSNADDAPDIEKCITGIELESGISDAVVFAKDKIIVGLDSGAVELISYQCEPATLSCVFSICEHDQTISSVNISSNDMLCVSASFDGCIKVWDVDTWASVATYRPAHGDKISRVSCSTVVPQVFLSCSQDGKIFLWDLRLPKPATSVAKDPLQAMPTCVTWKPESPTSFAAGDESGQVIMKDIRKTVDVVLSGNLHQRPIFRLVFSSKFPNWLASCGDDENVLITDVGKDKLEVIYKDNSHSDFVRDLSWDPISNKLYSCGWNKEVIGHNMDVMDLEGQADSS